jgi:hypothetical protein
VALPSEARVGEYVLKKAVLATTAKEVRSNNQHARRNNALSRFGHEDADTGPFQGCQPDCLGARAWFYKATNLAHLENLKDAA